MLCCVFIDTLLKSSFPKKAPFLRPTNDVCKCSFIKNDQCGVMGMPSGHAMIMTFFVMMIFLYTHKFDYKIILLIILALSVIIQRWMCGCHTPLQLFVGSVIGILFALVYNKLNS